MKQADKRLKYDHILIHQAIHDKELKEVKLSDGKKKPIKSMGKMRYVPHEGFVFMEQNPDKQTSYAQMARNGAKITWGITSDGGSWIYIDDEVAATFLEEREHKLASISPK